MTHLTPSIGKIQDYFPDSVICKLSALLFLNPSADKDRGNWASPGGSVVKNPPATSGDVSSISGLGTSPGEGNSNPLQYSCLGSPMDRGVWWATVCRVTKESDRIDGLNNKRPTAAKVLWN